jgi:hypothetical protein
MKTICFYLSSVLEGGIIMSKQFRVYLGLVVLLLLPILACGNGEATPTSVAVISTATPSTTVTGEAEVSEPLDEFGTEEEMQEIPAEEPVPTLQPTETPVPQRTAHMGDFVLNDGYSLTVLQVKDPAPPGTFFTAEPGKRLIAVEIVVGNVSGPVASTNPLNGVLLDDDRLTYRAELGAVGQLKLVELERGERVRGWIGFHIPDDAVPATFRFELGRVRLESSLLEPLDDHEPMLEPEGLFGVRDDLPRLGDLVEQDGYSLVAMGVADPASPGILYQPVPGMRVVAVDVIIGNVDGREISSNPLRAYLIDSAGYVYTAELGGTRDQIELVDLGADERVRGWIAFEIPDDAMPAAIKYEMTSSPRIVVYTGLLD